MRHRTAGFALFAVVLGAGAAWAQAQAPDPGILAAIRSIRAIDDHAHPPALPEHGIADTNYDALPCPPESPTPPTLTSEPDNPVYLEAWKALYGYPYGDRAPAHVQWLLAAKARIQRKQGNNYPNWVLDKLSIETELANRVAMGPGLAPPRFRWVAFDDALLAPLDDTALASDNPDHRFFYGRENAILRQYLAALGLARPPATLDAYLAEVVNPTLEREKRAGAVAIKFEAAYLRPLDFQPPDMAAARAIYARGGTPGRDDYYRLQDAIFHAIALEAGRLGLPVHFHTGFGCGSYFNLSGANPMLLEGVFNDPSLRGTRFVLLHAGLGPYSQEVAGLLAKPNVYTDISAQPWLLPTYQVAKVVRYLLEYYPDKVLFGTDLSPGTPEVDWEELGYQAETTNRMALAIALTGMMQDHEITRARALAIARAVLRGNALRLYGWPDR